MYYFNKVIGFLVSPIGVAAFGGLLAAFLAARGRHLRAAKRIGCCAAAWLWLWMTPAMTACVGAPLEREFLVGGRVPPAEGFPEADAIVLLGGSMGVAGGVRTYPEMYLSADRVWQAARLYRAGRARRIVATGDGATESTLPLLRDFGVDAAAVSDVRARNTEEEARGVAKLGLGKVLLVTSAWHMKRARLIFRKYAPEVDLVCAPADFENTALAEGRAFPLSLLPDFNAFMLNCVAFREWLGIVGYAVLR